MLFLVVRNTPHTPRVCVFLLLSLCLVTAVIMVVSAGTCAQLASNDQTNGRKHYTSCLSPRRLYTSNTWCLAADVVISSVNCKLPSKSTYIPVAPLFEIVRPVRFVVTSKLDHPVSNILSTFDLLHIFCDSSKRNE